MKSTYGVRIVICPHLASQGLLVEAERALEASVLAGIGIGVPENQGIGASVRETSAAYQAGAVGVAASPPTEVAVAEVCTDPSTFGSAGVAQGASVVAASCDRLSLPDDLRRAAVGTAGDPSRVTVLTIEVPSGGLKDERHGSMAAATLWAAIWQLQAHPGFRPENVRSALSWSRGPVSRRSLIRLSYRDLASCPTVSAGSCAAASGCRICVQKCPTGALAVSKSGNYVEVERSICSGCGICAWVCPTGAAAMPGWEWAQAWASVRGAAEALYRRGLIAPAAPIERGSEKSNVGRASDTKPISSDTTPVANNTMPIADDTVRIANGTTPVSNPTAPGFIWTCSRTTACPTGWAMGKVSCTAVLDARAILAPLLLGFSTVGVAHCGDGCLSGKRDWLEEKLGFLRRLVAAVGRDARSIELFTHRPPSELLERRAGEISAFEPVGTTKCMRLVASQGERSAQDVVGMTRSTRARRSRWPPIEPLPMRAPTVAEVLKAYAYAFGGVGHGVRDEGAEQSEVVPVDPGATRLPTVFGSGSPLGIVQVDQSACTLCGSCASVCPSGALTTNLGLESWTESPARQGDGQACDQGAEAVLDFDHGLCVACGNCVDACPERLRGAIAVEPGVDFALLSGGPVRQASSAIHRCRRCGAAVASSRSVERVAAILGREFSEKMLLCTACKGLS